MSFDMSKTVAPKSDQINADDLIAGAITIKVEKVTGNDNAEQPVNIGFVGDNGKPFRPCKSMRRVLIAVWGADASKYIGRSMTLFCDQEVAFGGMKVGGIRISHVSDIEREMTIALTATRAKKKPYTVKPLGVTKKDPTPEEKKAAAEKKTAAIIASIGSTKSADELDALLKKEASPIEKLKAGYSSLAEDITAAISKQLASFTAANTVSDDEELPI